MSELECPLAQCVGWRIGQWLAAEFPNLGWYVLVGVIATFAILFVCGLVATRKGS
jgi:hypothetical protein